MSQKELEQKSREVFHQFQVAQANHEHVFQRLATLLSPEYLKVPDNYFEDKLCLDAGCGSNANATYNILEMGAAKVIAIDLDDSFFETANSRLRKFEGKFELQVGNVLDLEFEDASFDFVHCAGVLHHTFDIRRGLRELARVTKPGGILFTETYGKGGLIREITRFLRQKYQGEAQFKEQIDNLDCKNIRDEVRWIIATMSRHGDRVVDNIPDELIDILFDEDLVLTIKDRIQAPVYHEYSRGELEAFLREYGFSEFERLTRYPSIRNVRRFLCPYYEKFDSPVTQFFYGDNVVQLKAVKDLTENLVDSPPGKVDRP